MIANMFLTYACFSKLHYQQRHCGPITIVIVVGLARARPHKPAQQPVS